MGEVICGKTIICVDSALVANSHDTEGIEIHLKTRGLILEVVLCWNLDSEKNIRQFVGGLNIKKHINLSCFKLAEWIFYHTSNTGTFNLI